MNLADASTSRTWIPRFEQLTREHETALDLAGLAPHFLVMQESALALMQLARCTLAIQELHNANLPYVVVLTDPTTGGATASYAMLGDIHLAEPGALIGFTGPRVIEQTIRETLPPGFQRSEYLIEKGMIDHIVSRRDLPTVLGSVLKTLMLGRARRSAA